MVKINALREEYTRKPSDRGSAKIRLDVIDTLSRLMSTHGVPRFLRSDNGPEFISSALLAWTNQAGIDIAFIEPGKPWQNGLNESFNGKFPRRVFICGMV